MWKYGQNQGNQGPAGAGGGGGGPNMMPMGGFGMQHGNMQQMHMSPQHQQQQQQMGMMVRTIFIVSFKRDCIASVFSRRP